MGVEEVDDVHCVRRRSGLFGLFRLFGLSGRLVYLVWMVEELARRAGDEGVDWVDRVIALIACGVEGFYVLQGHYLVMNVIGDHIPGGRDRCQLCG